MKVWLTPMVLAMHRRWSWVTSGAGVGGGGLIQSVERLSEQN